VQKDGKPCPFQGGEEVSGCKEDVVEKNGRFEN